MTEMLCLLLASLGGELMGSRIEVHGITSRPELNGKTGVATDFHLLGGRDGDPNMWR